MTTALRRHLTRALRAAPKTWLVTGVAGFIGSNLLEQLLKLDQTVVGLDNFSTGKQRNLDEVRALVGAGRWARFRFSRGTSATSTTCRDACRGADYVLHQAALGSVPRSLEDPITHQRQQRDRLPEHAGRRPRRRRQALRLRRQQLDLRGPPGAAQGRGAHRPAALALRRHQVRQRTLRRRLRALLRPEDGRAALLQHLRPAPGPRRRLRGGDPEVGLLPAARRAGVHQRHRRDQPRLLLHRRTRSRPTCWRPPSSGAEAIDQVYNVAVNARTTLLELFTLLRDGLAARHPHLKDARPVHRDFRAGDVLHSQADIGKARRLLGYEPTHTIGQGLAESLGWYEGQGGRLS